MSQVRVSAEAMRDRASRAIEVWLPSELAFIANERERAAGENTYKRALDQARLPHDHPDSTYIEMEAAWTSFREVHDQGVHHTADLGEVSGQQLLAAFYARLVDKIALGQWLFWNGPAISVSSVEAQRRATGLALGWSPDSLHVRWSWSHYTELLERDFSDTPFGRVYVPNIMECAVRAQDQRSSSIRELATGEVISFGVDAAHMAGRAYMAYAVQHLEPDQLKLPVSQHS